MRIAVLTLIQNTYEEGERMKICIDGFGVTMLQGTGLYSYTYELLDNLLEMYPQPEYHILWNEQPCIEKWRKGRRVSYINLNLNRKESKYGILESHIKNNGVNIFHSANNGFSIPLNKEANTRCRYIITVHDVIAASNSRLVDSKYLNKFNQVFPEAIEKTDKIIAVSEFIKNELINYYGVPQEKIEVIHNGCGNIFRPMEYKDCRKFLKDKYNIEGNIILFCGSIHPRKNLQSLIHILKDISKQNKEVKLVIAGKADGKRYEHYQQLKQLVNRMELEDKVYFTEAIDYNHMPYFYNSAKCVVNLSYYEGFPMSAVESLSCGTPVICSNTASFKEIIKSDGLLVHPDNDSEIKDAILNVLNNDVHKNKAMENSKKVRKNYSWHKAIKGYVRLYESMVF